MIFATLRFQETTLSEIKTMLAGDDGVRHEWKIGGADFFGPIQSCAWAYNELSRANLDAFAIKAKEAGAVHLVIENANGYLVLTF